MGRIWLLIAAIFALAAVPASAQQQPQQDPLRGQLGAIAIAPPPAEAAHLAKLMGDSLAALQPQRPGQQDVYLLAASLWSDPVFEREATQAEEILRQHLHAEGRSILLSAGGQGDRTHPAATPDNISAAIGQIASLMDTNEDLLVVFITTHGAPDGSAALREHNRLGGALHPANLADMLRITGIRNRVVIVSACFSGAFIAPLADDNTVVISAAQSDRTSFGCQPERDWTFFGDAYFNHGLREGGTILSSFDTAKTWIERWEREQNLSPPSNPQRFVGAHAAEMLRRAEQQH